MRISIVGSILTCILVLAACGSQSGKYGGRIGGSNAAGEASDPSSPAYFKQLVGDRVLFEVDQSSLTSDALETLAGQGEWLHEYTNFKVIIEGHADEQGTREYNLALGARRANTVRDYLVSRGVGNARIEIVTFGKERPLEICSSEQCWSKNRRAVTLVSTGLLN